MQSGLRTYDTGRKHTKNRSLDDQNREAHGDCPEESDAHVSGLSEAQTGKAWEDISEKAPRQRPGSEYDGDQ